MPRVQPDFSSWNTACISGRESRAGSVGSQSSGLWWPGGVRITVRVASADGVDSVVNLLFFEVRSTGFTRIKTAGGYADAQVIENKQSSERHADCYL